MTRSLIVDGTKEVIANGRAITMHAISKPTDYTHQRIVGYAVTVEDAHLFAAAEEMRDGCKALVDAVGRKPTISVDEADDIARAALSKSETR